MSEQSAISWEEAIAQAERSADALLYALEEANAAYPEEVKAARVQFDIKEQLVASFLQDFFAHCDITGIEESPEREPLQTRKFREDLRGRDFSRQDLHGRDFRGQDLSQANLSQANLSHANLSHANLSQANLLGADLSHANLHWARNLTKEQVASAITDKGTQLPEYFEEEAIEGGSDQTQDSQEDHGDQDLSDTSLSEADLAEAKDLTSEQSDLAITDKGTQLPDSPAEEAPGGKSSQTEDYRVEDPNGQDFTGLDLSGRDFSDANLRGANLSTADLRGADLRETDLRGANLIKADLREAGLRQAILRGADLRQANLIRAILIRADLREADLRGANLTEADLHGANLKDAKNLTRDQVDSAVTDKQTILPDHLK